MSGYRAPRLILSLAICCSALLSGCQANPNVIDDWAQRWKPQAEELCRQRGLAPESNEFRNCAVTEARRQTALVWCTANPAFAAFYSNNICAPEPTLRGVPMKDAAAR
jgi:hypothetical protein